MLSTTLRRILVASSLVVATSGFMASSAFAQVTTGSIGLTGSVDSTLNLSLSATTQSLGTAGVMPLDTTVTKVALPVATVSTNNSTGLTLYLDTGNTFKMTNTTNGRTDEIPYKVSSSKDSGSTYIANEIDTTGATSGLLYSSIAGGSQAVSLYISYTTTAAQGAGAYTGSIALKVMDNN